MRENRESGVGGEIEAAQWFQGNAAIFGGIKIGVSDRLDAKLEYSNDAYDLEQSYFEQFNWNVSAQYRLTTRLPFVLHGCMDRGLFRRIIQSHQPTAPALRLRPFAT